MAKQFRKAENRQGSRKASSIGTGGRGRSVKISTSTMNKHKKRATKKYRGQGK